MGTWRLGLGLFFPLSNQAMESLKPEDLDLETLASVADEAGEGSYSATLPGLLAARLEPLPPLELNKSGKEESAELMTEFSVKNKDERFFDPRNDLEAIKGLEGFVTGFYAPKPEGLELLVLYYEKDRVLPRGSSRFALSISELEKFHETILPRLFSWITDKDLSVYDIHTGVFGTLGMERRSGTDSWYSLRASRIFLTGAGSHVFSLNATGYQDRDIEIDNLAPFLFKTIQAPLTRITGASPAQEFIESSKALEWKEEDSFGKARRRFSASLGRFLVSLPLSLLSAGNFLSVQEAYLRYAKPASAYYGGAAFAGISLALSLGFTVNTIVALVDLLRISR